MSPPVKEGYAVPRWLFVCLACGIIITLFALPVSPKSERKVIFSYRDRLGDDVGPGTYVYPTDESFTPHSRLLDLTHFQVALEDNYIVFSFTFGALANPWNAPEGFYHPRIDLFIDSDSALGRTEPLRLGPGDVIQFDPRHPWDMWLRIAPWDGAALFSYQDDPASPGRQQGIHVAVAEDVNTIRVSLPQEMMPLPESNWHYYVLVGSFDALGVDGYRHVDSESSRWLIGGAPENATSRIIDLAAPSYGRRSQTRQLNPPPGMPILLYPIGSQSFARYWPILAISVVIPLLWIVIRRHRGT